MDKKEVLKKLGLSEGETNVYLALLRIGEAQVNRIKNETKMHRTTIYDFLDSLMKKGLVSYVIKNNIKIYRAANPSKLENLIKEKKEQLEEILPLLTKMAEQDTRNLKIEVFDGNEGFKTFINKMLEPRGELLAFGIDESQFETRFPYLMKKYFSEISKRNLHERLITKKGVKFIYNNKNAKYRYIDEKFFHPIPALTFNESVILIIWEPLTVLIIENKDLAESYRRHFELFWKIADRKP